MDRLKLAAAVLVGAAALSWPAAASQAGVGVRVIHAGAASPLLPQSCVRLTPLRRGRVEAVVRVGRLIRSVTLRAVGSPRIYGCDATGVRTDGRRWCNVELGTVHRGRIADPRLGLLCRAPGGARVATAWVSARKRTRTVVVADGRHSDRYAVAGGLPVRIAGTQGIRYRRATVVFAISEYDARGRLVGRRRLVARVAG